MNRAERRKIDRDTRHEERFIDTNTEWYNNLPSNRKEFIHRVILSKIRENDRVTAAIMDNCLMSAIDDVIDIAASDEKKIIDISNEYMLDYKECIDKNGGDCDMSTSIEDLNNVKTKIVKLRAEGFDKAKTIRELKKEFDIPKAILSDCWVEVKESEKSTLSKEERTYIVNSNESTELVFNHNSEDKPIVKEVSYTPENGIEITNTVLPGNLEVVEEIKVIKGKYGYYHKSNDGIRFSSDRELINHDIAYKDKEELIITRDKLTNEYLDKVKLLNKQIEELNNQLTLANKSYETMNNHFDEMEEVFSM